MSTFNGCVTEFPDIRIDFFRRQIHSPPPLACFLSHVHSDHLAGLENLRSPFVYCSAATREILLRLERFPCRINYAKGILEARQQTYKHLHKVLKPLPFDTPTQLELRPGYHIQVTLFDANHCPGAAMFLIEDAANAILYTGDIRSEPWFVNSLARNPNLIEYTSGIRTLDKLYLDTTFTQNVPFQTKAQGLAELIYKVKQYPEDTVFHFQAWTYGYEDVWIALSRVLKSRIHVDDYKLKIYNSLKTRSSEDRFHPEVHLSTEAPALTGFLCGNAQQPGCLTSDKGVRLHSCEKGNVCETAKRPGVVKIQPIITHLSSGGDILELGAGGGGDDLEREAELDTTFQTDLDALLDLFVDPSIIEASSNCFRICSSDDISEDAQHEIQRSLSQAAASGRSVALNLDVSSFTADLSTAIQNLIQAIVKKTAKTSTQAPCSSNRGTTELPRVIRFPYSRHSSYPELCHLAEIFKPKDIWPCTVDIDQWLREGNTSLRTEPYQISSILTTALPDITIKSLFGQYCSSQNFAHDLKMKEFADRAGETFSQSDFQTADTQQTVSSVAAQPSSPTSELESIQRLTENHNASEALVLSTEAVAVQLDSDLSNTAATDGSVVRATASIPGGDEGLGTTHKRTHQEFLMEPEIREDGDSQRTEHSVASTISTRHSVARWRAYYQTLANTDSDDWQPIGLISTDGGHTILEDEL